MLEKRAAGSHKGTYGRLLIMAGSRGMAGAAYMCGLAAFRCGMGMVKYLGPECNRMILQTLLPEAMYGNAASDAEMNNYLTQVVIDSLKWADCVIIGPGLSKGHEASELMRTLCREDAAAALAALKAVIIDADALNIIAEEGLPLFQRINEAGNSNIIITPHMQEMLRLIKGLMGKDMGMDELKEDALSIAADFSEKLGVNVILKDAATSVAMTDGSTYRIAAGCSAMAKAGSGDVLCGFMAGTAAICGWDILSSAPLAVYLHGTAGRAAAQRYGTHSILARDIAEAAGEAISKACHDASKVKRDIAEAAGEAIAEAASLA